MTRNADTYIEGSSLLRADNRDPEEVQRNLLNQQRAEEGDEGEAPKPPILDEAECFVCHEKMKRRAVADLSKDGKCPECDEEECWVNEDETEVVCRAYIDGDSTFDPTGEKDGAIMCYGCEDSLFSHPDTLIAVTSEGDSYRFVAEDGIVRDSDYEWGSLGDELQKVLTGIVSGTEWRRVDAWRGYNMGPAEVATGETNTEEGETDEEQGPKWVRALTGWHDSMSGSPLMTMLEKVCKGEANLDFPVVVVFEAGSNVCAVQMSLYCREENSDALADLLEPLRAEPGYAGLSRS